MPTCEHIAAYVARGGLARFRQVADYRMAVCFRLAKLPFPRCTLCTQSDPRLRLCVDCVFFGCVHSGHAQTHADAASHPLAIDLETGRLYCHACADYVFDDRLGAIEMEARQSALAQRSRLAGTKRPPAIKPVYDYVLEPVEREIVEKNAKRLRVSPQLLGLRGLANMGNTCFLSSVMQALIHTPPLRNFFLSDAHNQGTCKERHPDRAVCIACGMDSLVSAAFSGEQTPIVPSEFLYSVWQYSDHLAGYEQQDAHEFLMAMVDALHSDCGGVMSDCRCVVHQTFGGRMRSSITCQHCGTVSSRADPFLDVSLGIDAEGANTLESCLARFTSPEHLVGADAVECSACTRVAGVKTLRDASKRLQLQTLPLTLCVHLKRFEHSLDHSSKIDEDVPFPAQLDMSPFVAAAPPVAAATAATTGSGSASRTSEASQSPEYLYDLFAVVEHRGAIDTGHYIAYVRRGRAWFRCDDAWITCVEESQVLQVEAYLLFYAKHLFEYGPGGQQSGS